MCASQEQSFEIFTPRYVLYTRLGQAGSIDQKLSPLGQRGAGQHHFGAKREREVAVLAPEHKKIGDLNFIPKSPNQNPEDDK